MITRFFRAIVHDGKQEEFLKFFLGTMLPIVKSQDGLEYVSVGLPHEVFPAEFSMTGSGAIWTRCGAFPATTGGKPSFIPTKNTC